jgi:uncharacterized membrane protein YoaT (DUF817 family)
MLSQSIFLNILNFDLEKLKTILFKSQIVILLIPKLLSLLLDYQYKLLMIISLKMKLLSPLKVYKLPQEKKTSI